MCSSSTRAAPPRRARGRPQGVSDEAAHAPLLAPITRCAPAERPRRARLTAVLPHQVLDRDPPTAAEVGRLGANVVTLHQGNSLNPYINYPFFANATAALRGYIQRMHTAGRRVKLYFTTKESRAGRPSSSSASSAPRSSPADTLNRRAVVPSGERRTGGGVVHALSEGRAAAAPIRVRGPGALVNGASRWCNYYVEGVRWVLRHLKRDGIYLDGIRFLARCRGARSRQRGGVRAAAPTARAAARSPRRPQSPLVPRAHAVPTALVARTPAAPGLDTGSSPSRGSAGAVLDMLGNADKEADAMRGDAVRDAGAGRGGRSRSRARTRRCGRCGRFHRQGRAHRMVEAERW